MTIKHYLLLSLMKFAYYIIGTYLKNDDYAEDINLSYLNSRITDYLKRIK